MEDVDGMVGGLAEAVEDADVAACECCGGEHGVAELFAADGLRAAEREEDAAGADGCDAARVEADVAFQRVLHGHAMLGEGGRVEDDQIIFVCCLGEVFERVGADRFVARVAGEIQLHVLGGEGDGALG